MIHEMIHASVANKQSTAKAKELNEARVEWHKRNVESAVKEAINRGYKSVSYDFRDTEADRNAMETVVPEIVSRGYAVEINYSSHPLVYDSNETTGGWPRLMQEVCGKLQISWIGK